MSKFADVLILFSGMVFAFTLFLRVTAFSGIVVGKDFGLALIAIVSISASLSLCVKAGYTLVALDLKGNLISLATFGFLFFCLDLLLNMQNLFNSKEPILAGYIYLGVTFPAVLFLKKDLKGKQWFGT